MKSKVLITITIWFILNILLVNSQETKCPPDCSNPSKITETSYLDSSSYNDKKFYENSDPNKWNFNDPNFDYSKIPLAKYKELPYTNPDVDHSRLDPNKYISAFGCLTCTFRIATAQKIQYSTDGVFHTKTGLARIPGNYPPNTLFIATDEGIFIGLPKIDEKSKLDISNVGSATLITNDQKVTLSNGLIINGRLSFTNNQAFVKNNDEIVIDGISIKPKGNDVFVYFDGQQHQGNYISYGQKNLIAQGNSFDIEFLPNNKYAKVFGGRDYSFGLVGRPFISNEQLLQDDYLYFSMGNRDKKSGTIILTNRDDKNLLPLIETSGYVKIWNDRNELTINNKQVAQNYYYTLPQIRKGSVSMQVIPDNDNKVYTFDENKRIMVMNKEDAKLLDEVRESLLTKHHVKLTGFFDRPFLNGFDQSLTEFGKKGVDFSRYREIKGESLEIMEADHSAGLITKANPNAQVVPSKPNQILWYANVKEQANIYSYNIQTYDLAQYQAGFGSDVLSHELGHVFSLGNKDFDEKLKQGGGKLGISFNELPFNVPSFSGEPAFQNKGPDYLFPSTLSQRNLEEFKGELLKFAIHEPGWFDKQKDDIKRSEYNEPLLDEEVYKQRRVLRNIWLEELKKYKK